MIKLPLTENQVQDQMCQIMEAFEIMIRAKVGLMTAQVTNISLVRFNSIIIEAKNYQPPTADHEEIKRFMIRQLNSEIGYMSDYSEKELVKIEQELTSIDANKIRLENIEKAKQNIEYHTKEYAKEMEGCERSNKWAEDFINSLNVNK